VIDEGDSAVLGWSDNIISAGIYKNDVICIIDGDVFNAHELVQVKKNGEESDQELIINLYHKFGFERMLKKLNGDFAIALYDTNENELWMGRDRFGIKPLYYAVSDGELMFASQPRALLNLEQVNSEPDPRYVSVYAASHYRTFDNLPEKSPYKYISQLPAGSWLRFSNSTLRTGKYWDIENLPDYENSEEELAEQYKELLLDAVSIRLKRAEDYAFTLSGGMDSSSILCCANYLTDKKQIAFSSVYADKTYDERDDIQDVVKDKVQNWFPIEIDDEPDLLSMVENLVSVHDEPVATATWLSHALVCETVADNGYTSLFGGLGGDELNAGEYEYFPLYFADLKNDKKDALLDREISFWEKYHDHPIYKKNPLVAKQVMEQVTDSKTPGICKPNIQRISMYADLINADAFDLNKYTPIMDHPFDSYLKNRTWQDMRRETLPCCLRAEDRQSFSYGLKHFDPFLDYRLVEFMYRIPGTLKIRDGVTKTLLRTAMKGILPEVTRNRIAKTGWNAPVHRWFTGKGADMLRDIVNSRACVERGIYNIEKVNALINSHEAVVNSNKPVENHMMILWQILNLEIWLQNIK